MMTEHYTEQSKQNSDITLKDVVRKGQEYFRYLLSKWLVIGILVIIGAALGFAYAYNKEPVYTATTTFVLEGGDNASSLGQYAGLASMVGVNIGDGGGIFQGDNIIELYKSRSMIKRALLSPVVYNNKKELLIDHYINFNKLREQWQDKPQLRNLHFRESEATGGNQDRLRDSVIRTVISAINDNYLNVQKPDKSLSIIQVEVKAKDEFFAKSFNDQIVKNVNDFYVQTKTKRSLDNVKILQQKTDSVRAVMNGAIYTAAAVSDATPNLNPTRQSMRTAPVQRSQFSAETNKTILAELLKNLELAKISLRREAPLIQVVDQPEYPLDIKALGKIKGLLLGAFLFGFLSVAVYSFKFIIKSLLH